VEFLLMTGTSGHINILLQWQMRSNFFFKWWFYPVLFNWCSKLTSECVLCIQANSNDESTNEGIKLLSQWILWLPMLGNTDSAGAMSHNLLGRGRVVILICI
jgi:hypothetical protein